MVDKPGVLARGRTFFRQGYNIESLSVSEVIQTSFCQSYCCNIRYKNIVDQIKAQLKKLIPVHDLIDITELDSFIGKELILIKLNVKKKR